MGNSDRRGRNKQIPSSSGFKSQKFSQVKKARSLDTPRSNGAWWREKGAKSLAGNCGLRGDLEPWVGGPTWKRWLGDSSVWDQQEEAI